MGQFFWALRPGIRFGEGFVAVPLKDAQGKLWSLQKIYPDGAKRFLKGGRKRACFHHLGTLKNGDAIYVTEGYATGATVYKAISQVTVIAFDAGNLEPVIGELKKAYPDSPIIIAADNDSGKACNTGKEKAEAAARKWDCRVALPQFKDQTTNPTDFNDLMLLEGIGEVKRQLGEANRLEEDWPTPLPIKGELLPVEPFLLESMPESFQPWLSDIAHRMQCPLDYVAIGACIMVSSLIGTGCGIRPKQHDSWLVVPNLWGGLVAPPSTLKTPSLQEIMKPLAHLEANARQAYEEAEREYLIEMEVYKAKKDAIKGEMSKAAKSPHTSGMEQAKSNLAGLEEPFVPLWKRYQTNDATIEKLHELLSKNPRGLLLYRDELMGFFTNLEKTGHESDRAFYLEAWNGYGSYTTDRIGRGTIHTKNLCLSLLGSTQPDKLLGYLHRAMHGFENDGLFQRFQLLVYPDTKRDWEFVDQKPAWEAQRRVTTLVEKIAFMDFVQQGARQEEGAAIPYFHFEEDAQKLFNEWLSDLQLEKLNDHEEPVIVEHLAKYRKLMPALALIFHIIDIADGKTNIASHKWGVTVASVERAAAWCDYLESHARRIYGMVLNITSQAASVLARKIEQGKLEDLFTVRDIYRKGWGILHNRDNAEAACDRLVQSGWLREVYTPPSYAQRSKTQYKINPKIRRQS